MTYNFYIDPIRRTVTSEAMTVLWLDQDVTTIHFTVDDFEGFSFDGASVLIKAVLPDRTQVEITPENFSTEPITTEDDEGQTVITGYSTSFDWTLTLEHTSTVGLLTYSICAIMLNLDGETVDKEWHTLNDSFQIRDHIHFNGSDDQDDPVTAATNAEKIAALKAQVDGLAGGVKTAGAVSQMTDHSVAYVYTGSETGYTRGNWYYWNGSAWVSGGTYGGAVTDPTLSVAGTAADAKAVGDAMAGIGAASVPTEVRQAMKTLFSKAAYIEEGLADEVAVVQAWAEATTSITVSPATASVSSASPTAQLSAVTTPAGKAVTWSSSNTAVATVSSTGLVTGVGNGTCTITATSGTMSASCAVTVSNITATYTITNTLTNCSNSNSATSVSDGASYSATITADADYYLSTVTVTMGSTDVTDTYYSDGAISIGSVTGDIVITATATASLYPLVNGTFTFGDGSYITVTDGSHVLIHNATTADFYINMSDITENTTSATTTDNIKNKTTKFTIASGSTAVFSISDYTQANSYKLSFNGYQSDTASNIDMATGSINSDTSITKTFGADTNVGCLFVVGRTIGTYEFDVSFTVDGVKYV